MGPLSRAIPCRGMHGQLSGQQVVELADNGLLVARMSLPRFVLTQAALPKLGCPQIPWLNKLTVRGINSETATKLQKGSKKLRDRMAGSHQERADLQIPRQT